MDGPTFSLLMAAGAGPGMTATVNTIVASNTTVLTPVTSNTVTCTAAGGVAPYIYQWVRISGSTAITIVSPTSPSTEFTASIASPGSRNGVFRCIVTDATGQVAASANVSVSLTRIERALSAEVSPAGIQAFPGTSSYVTLTFTCTARGGVSPYSYRWVQDSGTGFTINSRYSSATTFTATGLQSGVKRTATFRCEVTDAAGATDESPAVTIEITRT